MATNAVLLSEYEKRGEIKLAHKALSAEIRNKMKQLDKLEASLSRIVHVNHVLEGVCLQVSTDDKGRWTYARTVASREKGDLTVHLYQRVDTKYWAVRVNEGCGFHQRFHGGRVIGLGQSLAYGKALAIAKRWLLGDEDILKAS